ncbi:MAG: tyrosine/phenylalanine carboxypeptidase domain-containing protein, partial [Candidatus Nanohaloarchaea archaeon]
PETGTMNLDDVMRELGLDRRTAFIRTYRVKRGLVDTSRPGGFCKDHIYFQGYRRIAAEPDLAAALYAGKVDADDLDLVDHDPRIGREAHLRSYEAVVDGMDWE